MTATLVRFLSTGRAGTKFIASVFADQGYPSYHEDLYVGEPGEAVMLYVHMLGDMWMEDREKYFAFESSFVKPYVRTVLEKLTPEPQGGDRLPRWLGGASKPDEKPVPHGVLIHTAHLLTTATPLIERELSGTGIITKNLILIRNPLKTIHALYMVESAHTESQRPYRMRPESFSRDAGFLGAANVWANTYRIAYDQSQALDSQRFKKLELEAFSRDSQYAAEIFDFMGLDFDSNRFTKFAQQTLERPLRSAKYDSARNSHIFHNPDFMFSNEEIAAIHSRVKDVLEAYAIDWHAAVEEYRHFHLKEKAALGFEQK